MRLFYLLVVLTLSLAKSLAQDTTLMLNSSMFNSDQQINLTSDTGWVYHAGHNPVWASPDLNTMGWTRRNPSTLSVKDTDRTGRVEGWFRLRVQLDSSFKGIPVGFIKSSWAAVDLYLDGRRLASFGNTAANGQPYAEHQPYYKLPVESGLAVGRNYIISLHVVDYVSPFSSKYLKSELEHANRFLLQLSGPQATAMRLITARMYFIYFTVWVTVSVLLALLFWLLTFQNLYEKAVVRLLAFCESFLILFSLGYFLRLFDLSFIIEVVSLRLSIVSLGIAVAFLPIILLRTLNYPIPRWIIGFIIAVQVLDFTLTFFTESNFASSIGAIIQFLFIFSIIIWAWKRLRGAQWSLITGAIGTVTFMLGYFLLLFATNNISFRLYAPLVGTGFFLSFPLSFLVYISLRFKEVQTGDRAKAAALMQITEEKSQLLANQNKLLEQQVEARTAELKASQAQLIQKEKLASLGELTAGIAHEIQNPLNFVNNFSEVSTELVDELKQGPFQQLPDSEKDYTEEVLGDLTSNLQKIQYHGGRASSIVKNMLEHSRAESGEKRPTNLNALVDEYLKIAYHGQRANNKGFNCELVTKFDSALKPVEVAPQEIGRVLLNLYNNAFYAVSERAKQSSDADYQPIVEVCTKRELDYVVIQVRDNGTGIPESVKAKILQPFFTTKPTGEGTGLGLSLSYDIITKGHGGTLTVGNYKGQETVFTISLPDTRS
jgi:signal transduction histidine kinase